MCPARFAYSSHRSQHIRTHTRELRFKCYICQKGFIRLDQLHKHLIVHTGVRKPYSCPKCHRSFSTQQSRDRHRFLHEDSRPFLCPYCDKTFKLGKQCRAHIKTHKFAEVVKSYRMKFAEEQRRSQPPTTTANYFDQTSYSGGVQSVMKHDSVSQQQLQLQHKSSYEGTFLYPADVQMFDYTVVSREQQFPNNLRFGCDTGLNTQTNFNPPSTSQQQYSQMAIYTTDNIAGGKSNNLAPVYYTTGRGENSSEPANNQPSDSFQDAFHLIFAENFDVETTRNGHRNRGESVTMRNDNNLLSHMNSFEDAMIMDSSSLDHLTSTIADIFNSEGMAGISALLPNLNLNSSDDLLMSPTDDTTSLTSPNSVYMTNSSQLQSTQQTSVKTSLSQIHLPKLKSTSFNSNDAKTIKLESKEVMDDKLKQLNGDILISEAEELQKCRAKRMIKCPECSIELRSRSLKEHLRRKHSTDKVPVECPVCSQKFSGKMEMKRHRDSKHKDQVKFAEEEQLSKELFSCLVCKTSLSTKEELDQHLIINHVETQQQRSSDVPPSSSVPVECTTGSDPKKCHYCEKNFKKPSDLIRHIRVHTGMALSEII